MASKRKNNVKNIRDIIAVARQALEYADDKLKEALHEHPNDAGKLKVATNTAQQLIKKAIVTLMKGI